MLGKGKFISLDRLHREIGGGEDGAHSGIVAIPLQSLGLADAAEKALSFPAAPLELFDSSGKWKFHLF